ncbi:hypothetical protein ACIBTP_41730 [Streptomyces avidinii]|uniref:hypothetical protein n=1 Tax=Streptomyces avidinii TaxID=1895 RepID=UPI0037A6D1B3
MAKRTDLTTYAYHKQRARLLDPVRVMHAVRADADRYGPGDQEQAEVPAVDVLAALAQLDEARAALDTLESDLTQAARRRGASWQQVADHLELASRTSAESRFVRLERDAASYQGDRYPERRRAERARDRADDAWCRPMRPLGRIGPVSSNSPRRGLRDQAKAADGTASRGAAQRPGLWLGHRGVGRAYALAAGCFFLLLQRGRLTLDTERRAPWS